MSTTAASERELRFTEEDMVAFTAGSGDASPLHTDRAFARSTIYGDCIVYGGLLSIALLGTLPGEALARVRWARSTFPAPVSTGDELQLRAEEHPARPGVWQAKLTRDGKLLARLIADARRDAARAAELGEGALAQPYRPGPELRELARRHGAGELHPAVLDGIGWASYVVGMGMPRFQGLCAAVDVSTATDTISPGDEPAEGLFVVREDDERTLRRLVDSTLVDAVGAPRTLVRIECFPIATVVAGDAGQ
jgi:acyl dehydratase